MLFLQVVVALAFNTRSDPSSGANVISIAVLTLSFAVEKVVCKLPVISREIDLCTIMTLCVFSLFVQWTNKTLALIKGDLPEEFFIKPRQ